VKHNAERWHLLRLLSTSVLSTLISLFTFRLVFSLRRYRRFIRIPSLSVGWVFSSSIAVYIER
jgi:hypothetical protein